MSNPSYDDCLAMYRLLQRHVDSRSAIKFNGIYKLPNGLSKLEYVTALLLAKGVSRITIAHESGIKTQSVDMRQKRAMRKMLCTDALQLKHAILEVEKSL